MRENQIILPTTVRKYPIFFNYHGDAGDIARVWAIDLGVDDDNYLVPGNIP